MQILFILVASFTNDSTLLLSMLTCEQLTVLSSVQPAPGVASVLDRECPILQHLGDNWDIRNLPFYPETVMAQIITGMKWKDISIFYDDSQGKL